MLEQNYRPPPCQVKDSIVFFYRYISTGQTSAGSVQYSLRTSIPPNERK